MAKQKKKKIKFYEIGNPNIPCLKHQEHSFQYISYDFIATNSETMNRYAIICNNCGKYFKVKVHITYYGSKLKDN